MKEICQMEIFGQFLLAPIVCQTILGLDSGNSFGKTNNKSYLKSRVPGNERDLSNGNFWTISKTLNNHRVRLHCVMKLKFNF